MVLYDLLEKLRDVGTRSGKVKLLKEHDCWFLRFLLKETYSGKSKLPIPKSLVGTGDTFLDDMETQILGITSTLGKGNPKKVILIQIEKLFKELEPTSAEFLRRVFRRDLKCGINLGVINEAFPNLIKRLALAPYSNHKVTDNIKFPEDTVYIHNNISSIDCVCYCLNNSVWRYALGSTGRELFNLNHLNKSLDTLSRVLGIKSKSKVIIGKLVSKTEDISKTIRLNKDSKDVYLVPIAYDNYASLSQQIKENFKIVPDFLDHIDYIHYIPIIETKISLIPVLAEKFFALNVESIVLRSANDLLGVDFRVIQMDTVEHVKGVDMEVPCLVVDISYKEIPYIQNGSISMHSVLESLEVRQENGLTVKVKYGIDSSLRNEYLDRPLDLIGEVVKIKCKGYDNNKKMLSPVYLSKVDNMKWESMELYLERNFVR